MFLTILENLIRDGTPPEIKLTLDRLMGIGYPRETAVE